MREMYDMHVTMTSLWRILIVVLVPGLGTAASIRLDPPSIHLAGPGASQRFIISGIDAEGFESDVTASCLVRSQRPDLVAVEQASLVGRAPGLAQIEVRCGDDRHRTEVRVGAGTGVVQVNFAGDILSILTTKGCNSSSCHGSPAGQAGFKLSLYGSDPAADHRMIVEMHNGRRLDRSAPAGSLLLKKPSFQMPHGGGHLLTKDSDEYRTLLTWIEQGARLGERGLRITRLDLFPRERILVAPGDRQPLVVMGRLSDGATLDMTSRVRFFVNDEAVLSPVAGYAATARARGLTVVSARAMGLTATGQFIVSGARPSPGFATPAAANFIDEQLFAKLRQVNLKPFPLTDDRAFVRRVYLDTIGMLPAIAETEAFLADARPDKRSRLIDQLLDREEYSTYWLTKFEDWFRNSQYYSQGRTNGSYKRWLHELVREDRPYDEAAREMLTATGDTTVNPAGNFWHPAMDFMLKTFEVSKAVPTITRVFLGQRFECAECHNHPLENLTQDDFYGMAAFLARTKVKHGYGQYRRIWFEDRSGEVTHPATKLTVAPRFPGEAAPAAVGENQARRQVLADWITRTQKLQFARAAVNRVWAEYFTIGIVDPPDDFRSTNMPSHPALLERLAEHFIDSGFRFKPLHRLILNSTSYQLAAHTADRPGGTDPLEKLLFARYQPRKLPAEALMDAVTQVTAVPFDFRDYPVGTSPKNLIASIGATPFLTTFGFPRRDIMERRSESPSLSQALHLLNNESLHKMIRQEPNVLGELLEREPEDRRAAESLYLRAYSRPPDDRQWNAIQQYLAAELAAGRTRRRAFENLLMVIVNSKEFQINR